MGLAQRAIGVEEIRQLLQSKSLPGIEIDAFIHLWQTRRDFGKSTLQQELAQIHTQSSYAQIYNFGLKLRLDLAPWLDFELVVGHVSRTYTLHWMNYYPTQFDPDFEWGLENPCLTPNGTTIAILAFNGQVHVVYPLAALFLDREPTNFSVVWHLQQQKYWLLYLHAPLHKRVVKPADRFGKLPGIDIEFSFGVLEGLDLQWGRKATLSECKKEGWTVWPAVTIEGSCQILPSALEGINEGIIDGSVIPAVCQLPNEDEEDL